MKKMADVAIDPFGEHESRPEEPTGENIPLTPVGGSTWEPEREQETSLGGESQRTRLVLKICIKSYQKTLVKPQNHFIFIISNSKMGNCATEAIESP